MGPFVFGRGHGLSNPVRAGQWRSHLRRREAAIPPSPPKTKGPLYGAFVASLGSACVHGEIEMKAGTVFSLANHTDFTFMQFHNSLGDCETEPH